MVRLVVVAPATLALIGNAGGQVGVGVGVGVGVEDGVGVASAAVVVPAQAASAMVVTARNMRSIGTSVVAGHR
ncbi:hypothetical protein [Micromonospora sp. M51]|uniref:hypothetical protein n=1 Tax=Micromonospora sp. M51 TaxID=2824889 RepID=UPI001FFCACD0|nr:hypothetical protein [Micromonospora sp. M51]